MPENYRRPHSHERVRTVEKMQHAWAAEREALATVRRFNAILSAKGYAWFWPKISAALTSKHHWLVIACDGCGTVTDIDLTMKPRESRSPASSMQPATPLKAPSLPLCATSRQKGLM